MKGGKIIRESVNDPWVIEKTSDNPIVNQYRELELRFLNQFGLNSSYEDSNLTLQHEWGLLVENYIKSEGDIEWKEMIDSIIELRDRVIAENRKDVETPKEIQIREDHEKRRDYWIPIRDAIEQIVKDRQRQAELKEVADAVRQAELKEADAVRRAERPEMVYDLSRQVAKSSILEERVKDAKRREEEGYREAEEARLRTIEAKELAQKAKEASLQKKREYEELKAENVELDKQEEKSAIDKAITKSKLEQYTIDVRRLKTIEANKRWVSLIEKARVIKDQLEPFVDKRNTLALSYPKQRKDYNEKREKADSLNDSEFAVLKKLGELFRTQDEEIKQMDVKIAKGFTELKKIDDEVSEIDQFKNPTFSMCYNITCFKPGLKPCSGCRVAYYCSEKCQRMDWSTHKPFCKPRGGTKRRKTRKTKSRRYNRLFTLHLSP